MGRKRDRKSASDVAYVLSLMKKHGAIAAARKRAVELMNDALADLRSIRWRGSGEAVALLESFARFAVDREW